MGPAQELSAGWWGKRDLACKNGGGPVGSRMRATERMATLSTLTDGEDRPHEGVNPACPRAVQAPRAARPNAADRPASQRGSVHVMTRRRDAHVGPALA
jgi:hypothetical protein